MVGMPICPKRQCKHWSPNVHQSVRQKGPSGCTKVCTKVCAKKGNLAKSLYFPSIFSAHIFGAHFGIIFGALFGASFGAHFGTHPNRFRRTFSAHIAGIFGAILEGMPIHSLTLLDAMHYMQSEKSCCTRSYHKYLHTASASMSEKMQQDILISDEQTNRRN